MKAYLVHLQKNKKIRIKSEITMGRMDCDQSYPADSRMSRKHCIFRFVDDVLTVEDLGSKNGIIVNEELIPSMTPISLSQGTKVIIGDQEFSVNFDGNSLSVPDPSLSSEKKTSEGQSQLFNFGGETSNGKIPLDWNSGTYKNNTQSTPNAHLPVFGENSYNSPDTQKPIPSDPSNSSSVFLNEPEEKLSLSTLESNKLHLSSPPLNTHTANSHSSESQTPVVSDAESEHKDFIYTSLLVPQMDQELNDLDLKKTPPSLIKENKNQNSQKTKSNNPSPSKKMNLPENKHFHSPKENEEIIYLKASPPSLWRTFLLSILLFLPVPTIFFLDPDHIKIIKAISSIQIKNLWGLVFFLPLIIVIPLQKIRTRTGWHQGWKSFFLSLSGMTLIGSIQICGIFFMKKYTNFTHKEFALKINRTCIEQHHSPLCVENVFTCSQCLKELPDRERKAFLETIYPFMEQLIQQDKIHKSTN